MLLKPSYIPGRDNDPPHVVLPHCGVVTGVAQLCDCEHRHLVDVYGAAAGMVQIHHSASLGVLLELNKSAVTEDLWEGEGGGGGDM